MAELVFFTGTMDCGKSTLALQLDHNHSARGRAGRIFTSHDRAGAAIVSSRLGLAVPAIEVGPDLDFWHYVVDQLTSGARIDYLICDEAQFYTPSQVEQLARVVDELQIDVFAFGIMTDFRTRLFPGSGRLVELADRMSVLQVEALCWCGKRATHNARTVGGRMTTEGEIIVVGDTAEDMDEDIDEDTESGTDGKTAGESGSPHEVHYEVLCRQHHRRNLTAARAQATLSPDVLPFGENGGPR